ncbi:MAG: alcohol dehydrogenase [Sphingobium sp.]|jgi:aryl-alcohol dehydrogenase|nr:MAG: alcohol dehydrogenase [Sphingobium sp.]
MSHPQHIHARAAVVRERGGPFFVEDVEIAAPRPTEILVRITATGLCHTDLIARDQEYPVPHPIVLGHEGAGIVERVGEKVEKVAVGDHVVLTFLSCGHCPACAADTPTYCADIFPLCFGGARPDGSSAVSQGDDTLHAHFFGQSSLATFAIADERNVVKVRRDAPLDLLGPLGCGIQTGAGVVLNVLEPAPGQSIAIFGAGAVGLSAVMAAHLYGCNPIIVVDRNEGRLALARELGAHRTINAASEDVATAIRAATDGKGAACSVEATGRAEVVRMAIDTLATRGTCAIVGAPPVGTDGSFDITDVMVGGKTIRGVVEGDSQPDLFIPRLVDLFMDGKFPIDRLVRHYPLDDINRAVADAEAGTVIKPIITMT